jgi:hypothetical protein
VGLKVVVESQDISRVAEELHGIQLRAQDIRAAGAPIRLLLQQDADLRFQSSPATETGGEVYGGVEWKALSESYLAQNPQRFGGQILRDTGELQQSLTAEGHPFSVFSVSESELVFGTALAKAGRLQRDRPFLFWHTLLLEKIADYLAGYVAGN